MECGHLSQQLLPCNSVEILYTFLQNTDKYSSYTGTFVLDLVRKPFFFKVAAPIRDQGHFSMLFVSSDKFPLSLHNGK